MKKILFFPQNDSHIANMEPISEWLQEHGYEVTYVDTSNIYYQNISLSSGYKTIKIDLPLHTSFYRLSTLDRLKYVYRFSKYFPNFLIAEHDILIIGNDGALQRVLINRFRKKKKKTVMLLDGLISNYSVSFKEVLKYSAHPFQDAWKLLQKNIKKSIVKRTASAPFAAFLPGIIGISPLSEIFVIGPHSKEAIQNINSKAHIYDFGLPRFWNTNNRCDFSARDLLKICYFPSAYKWHGEFREDQAQHKDIKLCCELIQQINLTRQYPLQLLIKMHPRESKEDYSYYTDHYDFVIVKSDISVLQCFNTCSLFLSNLSTVIIEGMTVGIPVYSLMIHFDYWKYKKSFLGASGIKKIYDKQSLYALLLENRSNTRDISLIEDSQYFCNTRASVEHICHELIK